MAQMEPHTDKAETSALLELFPPEFTAMGKERLEALTAIQTEQLETLQEMNRSWFERMQLKAMLASEFTYKLMAAHTLTELAMAYQQWAGRRMMMAAEDGKCILAEGQKLAATGARLFSTGWLSNGHGGSA